MSHDIPSFVGENPPFYSESHGARACPMAPTGSECTAVAATGDAGPHILGEVPVTSLSIGPSQT